MKFLMIRNMFDNTSVLVEVFKSMMTNLVYKENEDYLVFYYNHDSDEDVIHTLNALETELMGGIYAYISMGRDSEDVLQREESIAKSLLVDLPAGIYTLKSACLKQRKIENKKEILEYVLLDSGINEVFILEFTDNDLNVSRASKEMFIHRNTLIYKLNKLKQISGFDLTNFKDSYILYSLIENKS